MTVGYDIEDVVGLSEGTDSPNSDDDLVRFSASEEIGKNDLDSGGVSSLVNSLLKLPQLPSSPIYDESVGPLRPILGICKGYSSETLNLVWHNDQRTPPVKLKAYELWVCFEVFQSWKKVSDVEALVPPMVCTLSNVSSDVVSYFAIRAVDIEGRIGPFSVPCSLIQKLPATD